MGGETGPAPRQYHVTCPDCLDNELSPPGVEDPSSPIGRKIGKRRRFDCPTCDGYGVVPARGKEGIDQYMIPKRG